MQIDIDTLLAWGAAYKKVAAGEIIFREGAESSFYYQLVSGKVRWVNINDEGKEFKPLLSPMNALANFLCLMMSLLLPVLSLMKIRLSYAYIVLLSTSC